MFTKSKLYLYDPRQDNRTTQISWQPALISLHLENKRERELGKSESTYKNAIQMSNIGNYIGSIQLDSANIRSIGVKNWYSTQG